MSGQQIVNGVDIGASPSIPQDGLCPECREPFYRITMRTVVATQAVDGPIPTIERASVEGPLFTPCGHDARSCFPPATGVASPPR